MHILTTTRILDFIGRRKATAIHLAQLSPTKFACKVKKKCLQEISFFVSYFNYSVNLGSSDLVFC